MITAVQTKTIINTAIVRGAHECHFDEN